MHSRNPKPLEALTRTELAGRIEALRDVLDTLDRQRQIDGGPQFECVGRVKVVLIHYEARLREMDDRRTPIPPEVRAAMEYAKATARGLVEGS